MSLRTSDRLAMTFSLKLTLWFTLLSLVIALMVYTLTYFLIDASIHEEWEKTRATAESRQDMISSMETEDPAFLEVGDDFRKALLKLFVPAAVASLVGGACSPDETSSPSGAAGNSSGGAGAGGGTAGTGGDASGGD